MEKYREVLLVRIRSKFLPARDPQKDAEDPVLRMILWISVRLESGVFLSRYHVRRLRMDLKLWYLKQRTAAHWILEI